MDTNGHQFREKEVTTNCADNTDNSFDTACELSRHTQINPHQKLFASIAQLAASKKSTAQLFYPVCANGRTLNTSSSRSASSALTGTAVTAIVSPTALNTSIE